MLNQNLPLFSGRSAMSFAGSKFRKASVLFIALLLVFYVPSLSGSAKGIRSSASSQGLSYASSITTQVSSCCYAGFSGNVSQPLFEVFAEWVVPAITCQPGLGG